MNDQKQAALWAIEGKDVQYRLSSRSGEWDSMSRCTDHEMGCLMRGGWSADWEFRLKPRTVKIGNREVEAPVLEPEPGAELWFVNTMHGCRVEPFRFSGNPHPHIADRVSAGRAFASSGAALAAYEAESKHVLEQIV